MLLQVRHPGDKFVERAENEWPLARTQMDASSISTPPTMLAPRPLTGEGDESTFDAHGRRRHLPHAAAAGARPRSPARSRAKLFVSSSTSDADLFLVLRVFAPDLKEVAFQGAIDPHTPVAQGWLRASHRKLDPKLSLPYRPYHTHDEKQPLDAGRGGRARHRDLADLDRRAGGLSHRAHRCAATTTSTAAAAAAGSRTSRTTEGLRAVPARRSARPAAGDLRRADHAAFRRHGRPICCCRSSQPKRIKQADANQPS